MRVLYQVSSCLLCEENSCSDASPVLLPQITYNLQWKKLLVCALLLSSMILIKAYSCGVVGRFRQEYLPCEERRMDFLHTSIFDIFTRRKLIPDLTQKGV